MNLNYYTRLSYICWHLEVVVEDNFDNVELEVEKVLEILSLQTSEDPGRKEPHTAAE